MATETIPVIDLGPFLAGEDGALDRTAKELRFALTEIGFYFIVNHGVPREKIRGVFEQVKRFHAQPVEKKLELKIDLHSTGYLPMRGNTLRTSTMQTGTKPNLNEAFFVKRELPADHPDVLADRRFRGLNRWPRTCRASARPSSTTARRWNGWSRRWCGSMPAPSTCRREYFDGAVQGCAVLAAHDALPASGRARSSRRVRPRAAHRHQLPHPARAQRRARPVDPHPERQVDRRAGDRGRLCRERRPDAAALDQRRLPGDAAPRHQPQRRRALRHPVLLRQQHRLAGRRRADHASGPDKPPKYPTTYYTDYMVWYQKRNYDAVYPQAAE